MTPRAVERNAVTLATLGDVAIVTARACNELPIPARGKTDAVMRAPSEFPIPARLLAAAVARATNTLDVPPLPSAADLVLVKTNDAGMFCPMASAPPRPTTEEARDCAAPVFVIAVAFAVKGYEVGAVSGRRTMSGTAEDQAGVGSTVLALMPPISGLSAR